MNKKGSAMLLALVLCMAVLPAAGVFITIARSDLESALDDYHWARVQRGAWGALALVEMDLQGGGVGEVDWPDPEIQLEVKIADKSGGWDVSVTAVSERAAVSVSKWVEGQDLSILTEVVRDDTLGIPGKLTQ